MMTVRKLKKRAMNIDVIKTYLMTFVMIVFNIRKEQELIKMVLRKLSIFGLLINIINTKDLTVKNYTIGWIQHLYALEEVGLIMMVSQNSTRTKMKLTLMKNKLVY